MFRVALSCMTLPLRFASPARIPLTTRPVYISGRPFVLRDSSEPRKTLRMSDRAENLEAIEQRLKNDILVESAKCDLPTVALLLF